MIGEAISTALKIIKPSYQLMFGIMILGLLLLLIPRGIASWAGLEPLLTPYRGWISLASLVFGMLGTIEYLGKRKGRKAAQERRQAVLKALESLSPKEFIILAYCLYYKQRTIGLDTLDPIVGGLVQKGLLRNSFGIAQNNAHTIPDFVWDYLQKNRVRFLPEQEPERSQVQAAIRDFHDYLEHPWYLR